jgi:hypothetical protein
VKDQLPAPDFDSRSYERPNQNWVCGWLADGRPCKNGPNGCGDCGAQPECKPAFEQKPGEKGSFVCTRPKERGGPCDAGAKSDGTCGCPVARCQPVLSFRARRGLLTKATITVTIGILLVILYGSGRWKFINPGPISARHGTEAFRRMANLPSIPANECAACHGAGSRDAAGWLRSAALSDPSPLELRKLFSAVEPRLTRLDTACLKCHSGRNFHEPNLAWDYSCSACHHEHLGAGPMRTVNSINCVRCHGNSEFLQMSAAKGALIPEQSFAFQRDASRVSFATARPSGGFTKPIHEFSGDHPEFQIVAEKMADPDTLRFSHATHLSEKMVPLNGTKVDCKFCHQPGPGGVYYKAVTFEASCKPCHALQFDPETPTLHLPHGNPSFVAAFLRSLPQQYASYANRERGIFEKDAVDAFVRGRIDGLRNRFGAGEELYQRVFFSDERHAPVNEIGGLGAKGRSLFPGCAYCHQIKPAADLPIVTAPAMPERWMSRGRFDHSRHTQLQCETCHQATRSDRAADILLPSKMICANCHKPQGSARNDCFECHSYHNKPTVQMTAK